MVKMLHPSSTMEIQGTHRHNNQLRRLHEKSNYAVMVKLLQVAYGTTYSHFASNTQGILCIQDRTGLQGSTLIAFKLLQG